MTADQVALASGNAGWMLVSASLVLLMTPGLAFFYGGMTSRRSVLNMMMMSFTDMGVVSVIYVLWGWSMSYGSQSIGGIFANPFEFFGLRNSITNGGGAYIAGGNGYANVIDIAFQLTFAVITVAIISGAIASRVKIGAWMVFTGVWVTLVYFPLAHMVWGGAFLVKGRARSLRGYSGVKTVRLTLLPLTLRAARSSTSPQPLPHSSWYW